MKKLSLLMFVILVLGCTSKPNQTVYNRPNTVLAPFVDDFKLYPMDPQLNSVWVIRALRSDEEWAEYPDTKWIRTADVIKPMQANILADKGMPTGIYRKQLFSSDYECFAEPIKVKGNIIRFRVAGERSGTVSEYQLTLTVKNHATLAEAKQAFIERVEAIYKHINWDFDLEPAMRRSILNEKFIYSKERWQPAPEPGFRYHHFENHFWKTPLSWDEGQSIGGSIEIWREPLSKNGYKWGDPFVIRVILVPYVYP